MNPHPPQLSDAAAQPALVAGIGVIHLLDVNAHLTGDGASRR